MKEKMSKLIEMVTENKFKAVVLSVAAVVPVTGVIAGVCAIAKNQGGVPMAPAASEPSESELVASTSSEPSEKETTEGNVENEEVILISSNKQEVSKPEKIESTQDKASSQEDVGSESVTSNEEKDVVSKTEDTSSKEVVSKPVVTHKHSYTEKVVKASCEKGGYTKYTCSCGKSYKDDETDKLGHLYTDWKVTKKATTESTGLKECKCDKCGGATITETIPKKKKASNISSKIEVGKALLTNEPQYTLIKARVIDKRTWGEAPTITVINGDAMHVVYYNKKGKKIEFNVEQPAAEDITNQFVISNDGTYTGQYFGAFS